MDKELIRIERGEDNNFSYIYEELVPQETSVGVSDNEHTKNMEDAYSKRDELMREEEELQSKLLQIKKDTEKVQEFLKKIPEEEIEEEEETIDSIDEI